MNKLRIKVDGDYFDYWLNNIYLGRQKELLLDLDEVQRQMTKNTVSNSSSWGEMFKNIEKTASCKLYGIFCSRCGGKTYLSEDGSHRRCPNCDDK